MDDFEKGNHQPSLEEENKRQQKYWKKNYVWTVLVIVVVLTVSLFRGGGPVLTPGETQLTVQRPDGETLIIDYADVSAVSLLYGCNYGSCVDGSKEGRYYYGRWENEAWGEYDLCVFSKVNCCLVIETSSGTTVLNYSSAEETEQLYELLRRSCENLS